MHGINLGPEKASSPFGRAGKRVLAGTALALLFPLAHAQSAAPAKSGKDVVDAVCARCHATGANGAPKIGDEKAWSKREAAGLTSLTANALKGIRDMPSHGGNPGLSDVEIERAITYMVNASGGHWVEPIDKGAPVGARSGESIVQAQCVKCHGTGVGGAPRIGDRAAWIPRVKQGLDVVVRSAINGHGSMPARGGMANLTDAEMRNAVVYMFNAGTVPPKAAGATPKQDNEAVDGMKVYLGVVPASVVVAHPADYPAAITGSVPSGGNQRYLTIALFDAANGKRITDAVVSARVTGASGASAEKPLEAVTIAGSLTYGNYFAMPGASTYKVIVRIQRPGSSKVAQTELRHTTQ